MNLGTKHPTHPVILIYPYNQFCCPPCCGWTRMDAPFFSCSAMLASEKMHLGRVRGCLPSALAPSAPAPLGPPSPIGPGPHRIRPLSAPRSPIGPGPYRAPSRSSPMKGPLKVSKSYVLCECLPYEGKTDMRLVKTYMRSCRTF